MKPVLCFCMNHYFQRLRPSRFMEVRSRGKAEALKHRWGAQKLEQWHEAQLRTELQLCVSTTAKICDFKSECGPDTGNRNIVEWKRMDGCWGIRWLSESIPRGNWENWELSANFFKTVFPKLQAVVKTLSCRQTTLKCLRCPCLIIFLSIIHHI